MHVLTYVLYHFVFVFSPTSPAPPSAHHKVYFAGSSLFLFLLCRTSEAALDTEALRLVWYDEFQGAQLDWDKWIVDEGDGCDVLLCDWGNSEQQVQQRPHHISSVNALFRVFLGTFLWQMIIRYGN